MIHDASSHLLDPAGWMGWPQNGDHRFHFMRVLGAAQEGGSTISECFLAATHITPGDDESWYREWRKVADLNKERGDAALTRNSICTAQNGWLRASNYYRAAELFLNHDDGRRLSLIEGMQSCARLYLQNLTPVGEIAKIRCSDGRSMQGYFLRSPSSPKLSPVVICVGGPSYRKEEHLCKMPRYALVRGLSLLLVDLPDQGVIPGRNGVDARHDVEMSIGHCVDYLIARGDIDDRRIAIYGDGLGAAFATRAAASDHRFAAAVCDGGLWDLRERAYTLGWLAGRSDLHGFGEEVRHLRRFGIAKRVKCPMLVAPGEDELARIGEAAELVDFYKEAGLDISLRSFTAAETAEEISNPAIDIEFIYDWIVSRLAEARRDLYDPQRLGPRSDIQ